MIGRSKAWLVAIGACAWMSAAAPVLAQDDSVARALASARVKAAAGDPVAQFTLASLLYYGDKDTTQAVTWLRAAAAQGFSAAEFQLGQLHDFGFGVAQDDAQAFAWYRKAAEHGSAPGQRVLGDFYRRGRHVSADPVEAARWYQRGADGDDIRAQYQLGEMYFTGEGVARDYASAYLWFSLAAGQAPLLDNRRGLLELRDIAAARMTPEAAAEAERRVNTWRPRRNANGGLEN